MTKLEEIKAFLIQNKANNDLVTEIDSLIKAKKLAEYNKQADKIFWTAVAIITFLIFLLRGCPHK